jgi:hypothetical protein
MMKRISLFAPMMIAALSLVACEGDRATEETSPAPGAASPAPESPAAETSPSPAAPDAPIAISPDSETPGTQPEMAPAPGGNSYQEPNGLFQIAFPDGYSFQETGSGIVFISRDEKFGGSVDYGSAQGAQLSNQQLEDGLKAEYEDRLQDITWQGSEIQPDGSVRVDWIGTDPQGNQLDAISFVEQRGDTIFILNLFGVNAPYQDYNDDAREIVSTYRVRQQ